MISSLSWIRARINKQISQYQSNRQTAPGFNRFFHAVWRNPGESISFTRCARSVNGLADPRKPFGFAQSRRVHLYSKTDRHRLGIYIWLPESLSRFVWGVFAGMRFVDSTPDVWEKINHLLTT